MRCIDSVTRLLLALCLAALTCTSLTACTPARARPDYDPLERMNRKIFAFNDALDTHAVEPAAKAWDYVVPDLAQDGFERFLSNSAVPVRFLNTILQAEFRACGIVMSRFAINTVLGVGGIFDPAATMGLERQVEDTGQTFGRWGVPAGPYLVIPLLGPSNLRDAVGAAADGFLLIWPYFAPYYVTVPVGAVTFMNLRSLAIEDIHEAKATALDYYSFVRNAFIQRRNALIVGTAEKPHELQEDLYDYDLDPEFGLEPGAEE